MSCSVVRLGLGLGSGLGSGLGLGLGLGLGVGVGVGLGLGVGGGVGSQLDVIRCAVYYNAALDAAAPPRERVAQQLLRCEVLLLQP